MSDARLYTYADLEDLPYDEWGQYEIFDGELHVSRRGYVPHQWVLSSVLFSLSRWNDDVGTGLAIHSLCIVFSEHNVVIPDIVWITRDRMSRGLNEHGHLVVAPQLAVEVLSPDWESQRRDRETKLALYSREGVDEYWIVDWRQRTVEVYSQAEGTLRHVRTLAAGDTLETPLLPGFTLATGRIWPPTL